MKPKKITIDVLARMVANGFNDLKGGMDKRFDTVEERLGGMEKRMDQLESGQEDIKLRLDNAAWQFELKQLDERVVVLEKKAGVVR